MGEDEDCVEESLAKVSLTCAGILCQAGDVAVQGSRRNKVGGLVGSEGIKMGWYLLRRIRGILSGAYRAWEAQPFLFEPPSA